MKKTIKQNSFLDLINRKTTPTLSTDKNIAFINPIYSTVNEKEDLGINNQNLILSGSVFPENPIEGQMFVKEGKMYVYKKEEDK